MLSLREKNEPQRGDLAKDRMQSYQKYIIKSARQPGTTWRFSQR